MAGHIKIVAILHIVLGSLAILGGIIVLAVFGGIASLIGTSGAADSAVPLVGGLGGIIFLVLCLIGVPGVIAGIGMLKHRPWARILGIVISAIDLMNVPFGTALGIYGLWALLSHEGEMLFQDYT
jgi:hypothetical protein